MSTFTYRRHSIRASLTLLALAALLGTGGHGHTLSVAAAADESGWPQQIKSGQTTITIYQPQVDGWDRVRLDAHAPVAVQAGDGQPTTYGMVWLQAKTAVDTDRRLVTLGDGHVTKSSFPLATDKAVGWTTAIGPRLLSLMRTLDLDRLEASLAIASARKKASAVPIMNDAPTILFARSPSILVPIDGDPVYRRVAGTELERIINTKALIVRESAGIHYLKVLDGWMEAYMLPGDWSVLRLRIVAFDP